MPSFAISQFIILLEPLWVSAVFLLLSTGPSKYANYWGDSIYVARQDKKKYPSMEAAQNYIQGRFDLYSHLFRELSPPIPNECKRMFSINGCLAPGYTLAPPDKEEPDKQAVDDLLACLDDSDTAAPSEIQKSPDKPVEKNSNGKSKSTVKKKHAPTR